MGSSTLRASIDLGTNTCLLLVGEWDRQEKKISRIVEDISTIVRLGEGVDRTRVLSESAMERAVNCLKQYASIARKHGVDPQDVVCVATAQARDAKNGDQFFSRVLDECGFQFQVLSGMDEARMTFEGGLVPGMDRRRIAVIDIGGGSTEFMAEKLGMSLDMGAVRFTERYLASDPVTDSEFWKCQETIDDTLEGAQSWREILPAGTELLAVGGTATTLAMVQLDTEVFDPHAIESVRLTAGDLHRIVEELKWRSVAERKEMKSIDPKRADVILAGAMILWRTLERLGFKECRVSTRGLRFGILGDR